MSKIFVCVPTMNDFEFLSTIERAYDYASDPDNLSIATTIFWKPNDIQYSKEPFFLHIKKNLDKNFKKVKYDIQPWHLYPGVGHGRHAPTKFFDNEKYFLSIDSHTDFIKNWDEELIDLYENSRKSFGKLRVLTTYLGDYLSSSTLKNNKVINALNSIKPKDLTNRWPFFDFYKNLGSSMKNWNNVFPLPNDKYLLENDMEKLFEFIIDKEYLPAKKISAHCYFTESNPWLTKHNLNLSKNINFWGEEFYQSSLSYARGYNLVWYKKQILFHQYSGVKNGRQYKTTNNIKGNKNNIYFNYIYPSVNHNNEIIEMNDNKVILSLFHEKNHKSEYFPRSINGFLKYENIDFINKKTSPWWKVPDLNVVYK